MLRPVPPRPPLIRADLIDRVLARVAPAAAVRRLQARWQFNALTGGYKGARRDRRATSSWRPKDLSADAALLDDLPDLRDRSRDLQRNNPLAAGAIATKVTSVVGTGLKVRPQVDAEFLGLSPEAAAKWEREAERVYRQWAESAECDAARTLTFAEIQDVAFRGVLEAGDDVVLKRAFARPGSDFYFKVQLIEGDRLSNPGHKPDRVEADGSKFAGGVQTDRNGAPVAYHFAKVHPGDYALGRAGRSEDDWTRVPAFDKSGRRIVLHLYRQLRIGQTRGVPDLAPVIETLKGLGDYTDGELQAAVIASFFTVFIKGKAGASLAPMGPTAETGASASDEDIKLGPAAIVSLGDGDEVTTANPGRPNDSFDPFVLAMLRQVGVALELPYEILIKHFTASYSAARAALLEAWKYYRGRRRWLETRLCRPVYEEVIGEAVARGMLDAPGFLQDRAIRRAWLGAEWYGDAMPQIDSKKENEADALAEDRGWKTATENTAEKTGGDWRRKAVQRGREIALADEVGMKAQAPAAMGEGGASHGDQDGNQGDGQDETNSDETNSDEPNPDRPEDETEDAS